ncbi:MAG: Hsp70 family protein [Mycobacterium sp.]
MTRRSVVTLYGHRPAEVGLPSDNPNLTEPGLVLRGFVERVGDPVPLVAVDGSPHQADQLLVEALGAMADAAGALSPASDVVIAVPAYWAPGAVRALDTALRGNRKLAPSGVAPRLISDAVAALTALQVNPGLASRGLVALLDFGGSGTSITIADAAAGFRPVAETVRYADFSGDQIDQSVLTAVLADLSNRNDVDPAATAAVGSLARLRDECRRAKERLSAETATTVSVQLPGITTESRMTRAELETLIQPALSGVLGALDDVLQRNRISWSDLSAVATVGGGALIPSVTQRLSERSAVPVVTTALPSLDVAVGSALIAARGPDADAPTGLSTALGDAATSSLGVGAGGWVSDPNAPGSSTFRALAWSQDDNSVADPVPYEGDYEPPNPYALETGSRPQIEYTPATGTFEEPPSRPWYRLPQLALAAAALIAVVALGGVAYTLTTDSTSTDTTPTSVRPPVLTSEVPPPPPPPETTLPPPPPPETTYVPPPPETTYITVTPTEVPPPPPETTTPPPTTTTTTPPETTTTTTTTPPETTPPTTTPPTTTTTTLPPMTTTHLNIPFLPVPIPIQVPNRESQQQHVP